MKIQFNHKRGLLRAVFLAFILLVVSIGPNTARAADNETYRNLKLFNEVLNMVERNYVEEIDSKVVIQGAIQGMIKSLDPHSAFMTAEQYNDLQADTKGAFSGLGIVITMQDDIITVVAPIEDKPAFVAGVKAGDKITKINGETTKDFTIMDAVHKLRGKKGTKVTITVVREGEDDPIPFDIIRDLIEIKSVKHKIYHGDIGYIRISNFQETTADELNEALTKIGAGDAPLKGLVLDLRNNPGGLLSQSVEVSDAFLKSGVIVSSKGRTKNSRRISEARDDGNEPESPIVVLINGGTASAAEIVSGALHDNKRAILLGTRTFGKGSVQTIAPLKDGSALKLTIAKYYTPDGESIQAKGIAPDIVVEYAEPVADTKNRPKRLREKDLKGHIEGEKEEGVDEKAGREIADLKKDNQLRNALNLLRSWDVFKKM
ncbi:MAG: S41 family peptidase [Deltaproteobacteria bacterium]|nr:S41 family peptidase [Deltaproteobacteria bacterium]MBW2674598.1 S41 family peptidase [Deltaproteobacteria bacterium]